jgi:WD40 repeat protein
MRKHTTYNGPSFVRVLLVVAICLCIGGCHRNAPQKISTANVTAALLGDGYISRDAERIVFASFSKGTVLCWKPAIQSLYVFEPSLHWAQGICEIPGTGDMAVCSVESGKRRLFVWDPNKRQSVRQVFLPNGPAVFCFTSCDTVVSACPRNENIPNGACRIIVWRLDGNFARKWKEIELSWGEYQVYSIKYISGNVVFLRVVPLARDGEEHSSEDDLFSCGMPSRDSAMEMVVCDIAAGRVLCHMPIQPARRLCRVCVADGGQYAALFTPGTIELRSLPTLELRTCKTREKDVPLVGAVSQDGRYVAFGTSQLEVWDTTTGGISLIDRLNDSIVNSPTFATRDAEKYPDAIVAAQYQYCLACVRFVEQGQQIALVTHDGIFAIWNVAKGECCRRERIGEVEYSGR